jgi:hypothetical protein
MNGSQVKKDMKGRRTDQSPAKPSSDQTRTPLFSATMRLSFSLFTAALLAGVHASNVIDLVPDNFDKLIGKGTPALVEL